MGPCVCKPQDEYKKRCKYYQAKTRGETSCPIYIGIFLSKGHRLLEKGDGMALAWLRVDWGIS